MPKPFIWTVDPPPPPPPPTPPPKPTPGDPNHQVIFEGWRTTQRTVNMLIEARRLYGNGYPRIVQGGYNPGGTPASVGTHDRDALDFSIRWISKAAARRWELCLWKVGFAAWIRVRIFGLWETHIHCVPKDGDLSKGARNQVVNFKLRRNGLIGEADYPSIDGYADTTWESYLRHMP